MGPLATDLPETLLLPPPYVEHRLGAGAPFEVARARAAEAGAGALFVAERPGLLAFAVVLEPETPLAAARRAFPLAMAAVADALAALCPPERTVRIGWPDTLIYDGARLGGGRLAWPARAAEAAVPDWLVFGADLIRDRDDLAEPGRHPGSTSLIEEAFERPLAIVESFARHLMLHLDTWTARGYDRAAEPYLARLAGTGPEVRHRLAANGDLLARDAAGAVVRHPLAPALAAPGWLDPLRGGPRL